MENDLRGRNTSLSSSFDTMKDTLGPLLTEATTLKTPTATMPGATYRYRPTPPVTPPSACSPYRVSEEACETFSSPHGSLGRGMAAPTSVVDDVAERFGRPRARSLSRREMSLPAWEEEDPEGGATLTSSRPSRLEDRRRTLSMSFAEEYRRETRSRQASALLQRCIDCHLPPSFAMEGEPPIYCREHQLEGMVNVLREACKQRGCQKTASYGFPGKGRQRCFSHMEKGMAHVLAASTEPEASVAGNESGVSRRLSS